MYRKQVRDMALVCYGNNEYHAHVICVSLPTIWLCPAVTRQITSPTSLAINTEPWGPSVTPTGRRPWDTFSSGARKSAASS
jgi:hypothetical protein